MVNNKKDFYFYIFGFIFIFGVLNTFQNTMVFDIDFFRHFSNCFGKNVYTDINCPAYGDTIFFKPNYPAFGIVFTSGFFWLFNEFINNDNYFMISIIALYFNCITSYSFKQIFCIYFS